MNQTKLPQHVVIIMDGNRRWARQNKLAVFRGHEIMVEEKIENLVDYCIAKGLPYLTLWAFSTENWNRDKKEVDALMNIFRRAFSEGMDELIKKKVRIKTIGDLSRFPQDIQDSIVKIKQKNLSNYKMTLTIALNYGGRDEIMRMVRGIVEADYKVEAIDLELIDQHLDTNDLPDPDLIIRTGGEQRLSGFMPWQSVYAEFYFTKVLMPDFDDKQFDIALEDYAERTRRFGK